LGADAERLELPGQHAPGADGPSEKQTIASAEKPKAEALPARSETPSTQDQPSESTAEVLSPPTTPSSVQPLKASAAPATPAAVKPVTPAVPAVPVVPALPKASPKETKPAAGAEKASAGAKPVAATSGEQQIEPAQPAAESADGSAEEKASEAAQPAPAPAAAWSKPKLWAGLFNKPGGSAASTSAAATAAPTQTNGDTTNGSAVAPGAGSFAKANASSLAQALQAYRPTSPDRLAFLEPRGLVNTGNMCYMNSVRTASDARCWSFIC
jgi:ubiquitin carboxyl-terminal hydrolase 10